MSDTYNVVTNNLTVDDWEQYLEYLKNSEHKFVGNPDEYRLALDVIGQAIGEKKFDAIYGIKSDDTIESMVVWSLACIKYNQDFNPDNTMKQNIDVVADIIHVTDFSDQYKVLLAQTRLEEAEE